MVLPTDAAECLAAFTLLTYGVDALDVVPYLAVLSPTLRAGKSRLLGLLRLVVWRPSLTTAATGPALYRKIERVHPTLLLDEAETVRRHGDAADVVRALLQAGYQRGVQVTRCVGEHFEDHDFDIFGPKVFALIGRLGGALLDRCIVPPLRGKRAGEMVGRLTRRERRELAPRAQALVRRCRRWAADQRAALEQCEPPLPADLDDRAAELWEPLLAIGVLAGGAWPQRLAAAASHLSGNRDDESVGTELVADIHAVLSERGVTEIASVALAQALVEREGRPWAEWTKYEKPLTANGLARLLRDFCIAPVQL